MQLAERANGTGCIAFFLIMSVSVFYHTLSKLQKITFNSVVSKIVDNFSFHLVCILSTCERTF